MSIGFKKSILGFNCSDVINYIDKTHKNFNEKEKILNTKIVELESALNSSQNENAKLREEKLVIEAKLNEFYAKYDEIERLSENIGKLYLVAQENAKAIIENSENTAKIIGEEVNRNLYTIDEAHESLSILRQNISKTSSDFVSEVENLMSSLTITKEQIAKKNEAVAEAKDKFEEIYASIVKWNNFLHISNLNDYKVKLCVGDYGYANFCKWC